MYQNIGSETAEETSVLRHELQLRKNQGAGKFHKSPILKIESKPKLHSPRNDSRMVNAIESSNAERLDEDTQDEDDDEENVGRSLIYTPDNPYQILDAGRRSLKF